MIKNILKKFIYMILFVLFFIMAFFHITRTKYFTTITNYILQNIIQIDGKIGKIERDGWNIIISDILLKENNNIFANVKKAVIKINFFIPSRITYLELNDGNVYITRNNDDFNFYNIIKIDEENDESISLDRTQRLAPIVLKNIDAIYTDNSYNESIKIPLKNVFGTLFVSLKNIIDIKLKGELETDYNEKVSMNLYFERLDKKESKNKFLEIINEIKSFESDTDDNLKKLNLGFGFNNIILNQKLGQFLPIEDIKVKNGVLNGNFILKESNNKIGYSFLGNLSIENGKLRYSNYYQDIDKIKANIVFLEDDIKVSGNTMINDGDVNLDLIVNVDKENLKLNLDVNNIRYEDASKYELLYKKIDAKGRLNANLFLDLNYDNIDINDFKLNVNSKKIESNGVILKDIKMDSNIKNDIFNIDKLNTNLEYKQNENIYFNSNLDLKLNVNLKNYKINSEYLLNNIQSPLDLKKINGKFKVENLNNVNFEANAEGLYLDGRYNINKDDLRLRTKSDKLLKINYEDKIYEISPNIDLLSINLKDKKINKIESNFDFNIFDEYSGNIKINGESNENILDIKSILDISGEKILLNGNVDTREYNGELNIKGDNINTNNILSKLKDIELLKDSDLGTINLDTNIKFNKENIKAIYNLESNNFNSIFNYDKFNFTGEFNSNLLNKEILINSEINLGDLWYKYHLLKDVKTYISYDNDKINFDINNENLNIIGNYDIKNQNIDIVTKLNDYTLYNTSSLDINLILSNLYAHIYGNINKLNGEFHLDDSPLMIASLLAGNLKINGNIKDSIVNISDMTIRDSKIKGSYDINSQNIDINAEIKEDKLMELLKMENANLSIDGIFNVNGTLNNLNLYTDTKISNTNYSFYKLPNIELSLKYDNFNYENLFKEGYLELSKIKIYNDTFNYFDNKYDKINLATYNFDEHIKDKKIDLSKFNKNNDNKLNGDILLSADIVGKLSDLYIDLNIYSDEINFESEKLKKVYFDSQASKDGLNINRIYMEYENNPLSIDGYLAIKPLDYNFRLNADDINMSFLNLNKNIEKASGNANINLLATRNDFTGDLYLDNFKLKSNKNLEIDNLVADISIKNKEINFNQFTGIVNNGIIDIFGKFNLPEIQKDFIKTKRLNLGLIDLNMEIENVDINYDNIYLNLTSKMKIKDEDINGNISLNKGQISNIPSFILSSTENTNNSNYFSEIIKEISKKFLDQYNIETKLEIQQPIKIKIPSIYILKELTGDISGNMDVVYFNGKLNVNGNIGVNNSSFNLNKYLFNIDNLDIILKDQGENLIFDPTINLRATTNIEDQEIEIDMSGPLSERNLEFKSSSGKTQDEILALLTLNLVGLNSNKEDGRNLNSLLEEFRGTKIIGTALETAINELLFSRINSSIQSFLGLNSFKISTNLNTKTNSTNIDDIFKDTSTTLSLKKAITSKENVFFNAEVLVPFDFTYNFTNKLRYNMWISYDIQKGFSLNAGIKTPTTILDGDSILTNNFNFYGGIDYSMRYYSLSDLFENMSNLFNKRVKMKKEDK